MADGHQSPSGTRAVEALFGPDETLTTALPARSASSSLPWRTTTLDLETRAVLHAYTAGVNAYIQGARPAIRSNTRCST